MLVLKDLFKSYPTLCRCGGYYIDYAPHGKIFGTISTLTEGVQQQGRTPKTESEPVGTTSSSTNTPSSPSRTPKTGPGPTSSSARIRGHRDAGPSSSPSRTPSTASDAKTRTERNAKSDPTRGPDRVSTNATRTTPNRKNPIRPDTEPSTAFRTPGSST